MDRQYYVHLWQHEKNSMIQVSLVTILLLMQRIKTSSITQSRAISTCIKIQHSIMYERLEKTLGL